MTLLPTVDFCGLTATRMLIGANPFGGALQWIAQINDKGYPSMFAAIDDAVVIRAKALYLHGRAAEQMYDERDDKQLRSWLDRARAHGIPMEGRRQRLAAVWPVCHCRPWKRSRRPLARATGPRSARRPWQALHGRSLHRQTDKREGYL